MKITTHILTHLLIVLIIINSIKVSLTYAYFTLDPIGFIENLCENTDQPELACNGKCQLKKVAESQNKEQNKPENLINFKDIILYSSPVFAYAIPVGTEFKIHHFKSYTNFYTFQDINECFHPPKL